ncbi:type III-A CRISPR-associated RAMP protein Csm3 [Hydrogenobacter sp. T-8]|nr:type III-A CRISPR-associated RAMP protein Csm3 [Hydrogenobacter sp. T-8]
MAAFNFVGSLVLEYELQALTGLRIGGSKENFDIGGLDNPVIKTYISIPNFYEDGSDLPKGTPYIPGSSLKGKIRSLLEWSTGRVEEMIRKAKEEGKREDVVKTAGSPCDCGKCSICILFGTGNAKTLENLPLQEQPGPPRLIFSDAYPTKKTLEMLQKELGEGIFTEIKTENQINRINSRANPRKVERVPAGAVFVGRIVLNLYKEEDKNLLSLLLQGMRMLEYNYLGGYGSRGSGRVKFEKLNVEFKSKSAYLGKAEPKRIEGKKLEEIRVEELLELCS